MISALISYLLTYILENILVKYQLNCLVYLLTSKKGTRFVCPKVEGVLIDSLLLTWEGEL